MINITSKIPIIGIYKIISPSSKIYIGQSINIDERKRAYVNLAKSSLGPKIYNSINKHGWGNHTHEIIEECSIEQLNERETYWKQHYVNQYGWVQMLFCGLYDNGGGPLSDETKLKISQSNKGREQSHKGKSKPKGFGAIISNQKKGKLIFNKWKPIIQYDLKMNIITEYESKNEAFRQTQIKGISNAVTGRSNTAGGFIWKYKIS